MRLHQLGYIIGSITFVFAVNGINALPTGTMQPGLTGTSTETDTNSSVEDVRLDVIRRLKRYSGKTHDKDEDHKGHPKSKEHKGHTKNKGHNDDDANNGNVNGWLSSDPDAPNDSMSVQEISSTRWII